MLEAARVARPVEYPPEIPADLAAILNRACAPAPEDRHTSVDDLAAALRGFLRHREAAALADATLARGHLLDTALESGDPAAVAAIW